MIALRPILLMQRALLGACLLVALALPSGAAELGADDRAALDKRISAYRTAIAERDAAGMVEATPPRILELAAARTGLDTAALRARLVEQIGEMLENATTFDFALDTDAMRVRSTEAGVTYVLIPTRTEIVSPETGRVRSESSTLAFIADGRWWLAGTQGPESAAALEEAYPELRGITIPAARMRTGE